MFGKLRRQLACTDWHQCTCWSLQCWLQRQKKQTAEDLGIFSRWQSAVTNPAKNPRRLMRCAGHVIANMGREACTPQSVSILLNYIALDCEQNHEITSIPA
jgi:hypothetical protein